MGNVTVLSVLVLTACSLDRTKHGAERPDLLTEHNIIIMVILTNVFHKRPEYFGTSLITWPPPAR